MGRAKTRYNIPHAFLEAVNRLSWADKQKEGYRVNWIGKGNVLPTPNAPRGGIVCGSIRGLAEEAADA
jgi:hypothetical protein